jgi:TolA-binding protein
VRNTVKSWTRSGALLILSSLVCIAPCATARGQSSSDTTANGPDAAAQAPAPGSVILTPEEVRRQNEINSRVPALIDDVERLEDENGDLRKADDEHKAEAASEAARAEKASKRAELSEAQLADCTTALAAEKRRGFWGKIAAVFKAAPVAFAAGAGVGAVVAIAALSGGR